ncbi:MAG: DUF4160 domain-containing protein [Bacteroidota bacterium]|nr:DUF4160 domain-containing protein [Bacteroidota bacterium]
MSVIYRYNGFVFFFFSSDRPEPRHVHVREGRRCCTILVGPVELVKSAGFRPSQLSEIRAIIEQNYENFIKQWDRYFG